MAKKSITVVASVSLLVSVRERVSLVRVCA